MGKTEDNMIHKIITPIDGYIRSSFITGVFDSLTDFIPAKIIALSCYPDCVLTIQVLLNSGAIYSDLPIFAFTTNKISCSGYSSTEEAYTRNVPSAHFIVYPLLPRLHKCIFKRKFNGEEKTLTGAYLTTIDWYADNVQEHLVVVNSNLYLVEQPKILFIHDSVNDVSQVAWPRYRKARCDWKFVNYQIN